MPFVCCKYRILDAIILAVFVSLYFVNCENNNIKTDPNILAKVGDRLIGKDDFTTRYKDFRRRTGAPDNGQARRSILKNIISEELLILEARRRGFEDDALGRHELEKIKTQELLNAYHASSLAIVRQPGN